MASAITMKALPKIILVAGVTALAHLATDSGVWAGEQPWNLVQARLENGLTVVTHEDFSNPLVSVQVWYHVGSKDEPETRQGMAHLVEHLMFRGSAAVGDYQHGDLIQAAGGNTNAYTYFDHTAYVNTVPVAEFDLALWLEAERMAFLDVRDDAFETERNVVEEERRTANLNAPYGTLPERVMAALFEQHPYRWLPIGTLAHLRATTPTDVRRFWDIYYVPNNATLVIAGAVTHESALAAARRYFGWIPRGAEPPRVRGKEPPQTSERDLCLPERRGPVPLAGYVYRGVPASHPDAIPLRMVLWLLAHGEDSRMYRDLVRERGLCVVLLTQDFCLEQDGVAGFVGALHPVRYYLGKLNPLGRPGDAIFRAFDRHIAEFQRNGPTPGELEKVKQQFRRAAASGCLTVEQRAWKFGEAAILHGDPDWVNREAAAVEAVTAEDLRRVASTCLTAERRTRVRVLPDRSFNYEPGAGVDLAPPPFAEAPWHKAAWTRPVGFPATPPVSGTPPEIPTIPAQKHELANGLNVVVIPDRESPLFLAAMGFREGPRAEPRPGATALALKALSKGTENRSADELAQFIEQRALMVQEVVVMDASLLAVSGLSETGPDCLDLLAELVISPTFPRSELRQLRRQERVMLRYAHSDPSYRADIELRRRLFGADPYARAATGGPGDVRRLNRRDVTHWWQAIARPDDAVLYLGGDLDPETAVRWAEQAFSAWTAPTISRETVSAALPPSPEPARVYLTSIPGAVQSQIRIGQLAFAPDHPDYFPAQLFSEIYGGSFDSRLNKALRGAQGRTYGAYGGFTFFKRGGYFASSVSTQTEQTSQALASMLDVLEGMRAAPPSPDELQRAVSHLTGRTILDLETFAEVISWLWYLELMELPSDYLARSYAAFAAMTPEDILRVAQEQVDPSHLTIAVTGDAEAIEAGLQAFGTVTRSR